MIGRAPSKRVAEEWCPIGAVVVTSLFGLLIP